MPDDGGYVVPPEIAEPLLEALREGRDIWARIDITPRWPPLPAPDRWPRLLRRWAGKHR